MPFKKGAMALRSLPKPIFTHKTAAAEKSVEMWKFGWLVVKSTQTVLIGAVIHN